MITTKLPKYALVLEDAIPSDLCDKLIANFDHSELERVDKGGYPTFTQLNVNEAYPQVIQLLTHYTRQVFEEYKKCYRNVTRYLPTFKKLESFRVKRYNCNSDDRFDLHVDVASTPASTRALSFLYYLNDNFTGGETHFEGWPQIVPRKGNVLVFPPYWMFPHAGLPVITGTKYIMSTYLHVYDSNS